MVEVPAKGKALMLARPTPLGLEPAKRRTKPVAGLTPLTVKIKGAAVEPLSLVIRSLSLTPVSLAALS